MHAATPEITRSESTDSRFKRLPGCVRQELSAFLRFLARPRRTPIRAIGSSDSSGSSGAAGRVVLALLCVIALDAVVFMPIEFGLGHWFELESTVNLNSVSALFSAVIAAPIIEELFFRAGLRSVKYGLFIAPALIVLLVGKDLYLTCATIALILMIAISTAMRDDRLRQQGVTGYRFARGRRFITLYPIVFWLFAIAFALSHSANFTSNDTLGLVPFFAVGSQLMAGVVMGYLRLRDRLRSAIALHFLNNLLVVALGIMAGEIHPW